MIFFHNRTAYTAANTSGHFDEALMYLTINNVLECCNAVLNTIKSQIGVSGNVLCHSLENTAGCREKSCTGADIIIHFLLKLDILRLEPFGQFFKCKHCIHDALIVLSFVLFGYTRTDKYRLCIRKTAFNIFAVCLHRRYNVCKIFKCLGIMLLNQKVDGMTAGCDDDISLILFQHSLVLGLNDGCTDCGLLNVIEAKLL